MKDNTQDLDEILNKAMVVQIQNSVPLMPSSVKVVEVRLQYQEAIRQLILDWHDKQILEMMKDEQYDDERSLSMFKYVWRNKLKESKGE